jgi:hypothetical protein
MDMMIAVILIAALSGLAIHDIVRFIQSIKPDLIHGAGRGSAPLPTPKSPACGSIPSDNR